MIARTIPTAVAVSVAADGCLHGGRVMRRTFPASRSAPSRKTMERRTSCLQSNVDFLQKTITKLTLDHQQKLDAANRQIEGIEGHDGGACMKTVSDLQAAQKKTDEDTKKKADAAPAKDAAPGKRARSS